MSIVEAEHPAGVPVSVSVEIGGKEISFETGKLAKQADGAVVVRSGDTVVLGTAQGRTEAREGADFFPLTVDVEERMYAAGKIPGGFFKREGRPTERAILTARMTDRPVRPLWPKGYRNETQCVATVFSADMVTAHDILCINAVSAALTVSPLPFLGPIGAVRMGIVDGNLVVNPTLQETEESELDLIVVGTKDGLTMVEAGANQVHEDKLLEALEIAHREIVKLCDAQLELRAKKGKTKWLDPAVTERLEGDVRPPGLGAHPAAGPPRGRCDRRGDRREGSRRPVARRRRGEGLRRAAGPHVAGADPREAALGRRRDGRPREVRERPEGPHRRRAGLEGAQVGEAQPALRAHRRERRAAVPGRPGHRRRRSPAVKDSLTKSYVKKACEAIYKSLVRQKIAVEKRRPDGRTATQIRPIEVEVSVMPRTHGSGLFTRGQTQIMSLLTLGTAKEGQRIDDLSLERDRRFMHHYNFPPYSVGETGRMGSPKRRDIGHGALAQRALEAGPAADRGLPVHDPHRLRDARVERLVVDGLGLRLDPRADGRRCADHGPRLRHRDGPRQGRRRVRDPHRHPGRGGPPGRHGLQGRRHAGGHHRPADGHQDHRRQPRDHAAGPRPGEGRPHRDPRRR